MNILFLTMSRIVSLDGQGIYLDLFRKFVKEGHHVCIAAPAERRLKEDTNLKEFDGYSVLRIKVGNLQKTNIIEKGISTVLLESQFLAAIKKYYKNIKFDAVIYSTPPITFSTVINYVKKRDNAKSYLLLKDIFPQNAVDLKMFSEKSIFYKFFRNKEKKLYLKSDYIGCMSQANVDYLTEHNPYIDKRKVHVSPNSFEVRETETSLRDDIRRKYNIPKDATVFIYGGNLGKPQDIPFIIECLKQNENKKDRFFVICGTGTDYHKIKAYFDERKTDNMLLLNGLPMDEYEEFVGTCDVGLIFLDHRFTIPNFPSRILSYMQKKMPVLACTDPNTDIGKVIVEGDFGWWCESNDVEKFTEFADLICKEDLSDKKENALRFLKENYTVDQSYDIIMNCLSGD